MSTLTKTTEEIVTYRGEPLRLSLEPVAIRQHFESCGKAGERLAALSDETLADIGLAALASDLLETAFNHALRDACQEIAGFDPEGDPAVEFREIDPP